MRYRTGAPRVASTGSTATSTNRVAGRVVHMAVTAWSPAVVLNAQRSVGNRAVGRMLVAQPNSASVTAVIQRDVTNPLEEARAALAGGDLNALKVLNQRFRRRLAEDQLAPSADLRGALADIRHTMMDQVSDLYVRSRPTGGQASDGTDHTGDVEQAQTQLSTDLEGRLDVLMEGDPQFRYEHFNQTVQQNVFAALRLRASREALSKIGHRADAEREARDIGRLPGNDAWCGAFAFTQQHQASGMDSRWAALSQGEGGIRGALAYQGVAADPWIWAFDHWVRLREYHGSRGSTRWYEAIRKAPPSRGIEPGDLVLIDNAYGTDPDHITTAVAFDGRFLVTIGGNQGSGEQGVSRSRGRDLMQNPDPNDVRLVENGRRVRKADPTMTKNTRVHGVGRWSIVDYEQHIYRTSAQMPATPPTPRELATAT